MLPPAIGSNCGIDLQRKYAAALRRKASVVPDKPLSRHPALRVRRLTTRSWRGCVNPFATRWQTAPYREAAGTDPGESAAFSGNPRTAELLERTRGKIKGLAQASAGHLRYQPNQEKDEVALLPSDLIWTGLLSPLYD